MSILEKMTFTFYSALFAVCKTQEINTVINNTCNWYFPYKAKFPKVLSVK